jgi:hypothetical protein
VTTVDVITAIQLGQLVEVVSNISPNDATNWAGRPLSVGSTNDTVVTTVYANDLATDMDASRDDVSIGLVCQADTTGDVVVAIRGTHGIWEWIHDINFFLVPCPFLAAGGIPKLASPRSINPCGPMWRGARRLLSRNSAILRSRTPSAR